MLQVVKAIFALQGQAMHIDACTPWCARHACLSCMHVILRVSCDCDACTQDHGDTVHAGHTSARCITCLTSRAWFTAVLRFLQECHTGVYGTVLWSQH